VQSVPSFGLDKLEALVGRQRRAFDDLGMLPLMAVLAIGTALARVRFMIPGTGGVSLGLAGGPLMAGLIVGHFGGIGPWSLKPSGRLLNVMREAGLMLFLAGAGVAAGHGFRGDSSKVRLAPVLRRCPRNSYPYVCRIHLG
jgi:putative transport protein